MVQTEEKNINLEKEEKRLRQLIGSELKSSGSYLTEATKDGIRHFAEGIGDSNPLWTDEDYAKSSTYGCIVASPTMLYTFEKYASGGYAGGLPGVHGMFGGADWEWFMPVRVGDKITSKVIFKDLVEKASSFSGRMFQQISEITFFNQHGQKVARVLAWNMRTLRQAAREKGKYKPLVADETKYTQQDLERIADIYSQEITNRRGKSTRYWEDVQVGEELPQLVRGPLTVTDVIVFLMGWGGAWLRSHGKAVEYYRKHPAAGIPNEQGALEPPEAVHWDDGYAKMAGVPRAYDYGPERISWLTTLMTNWISDAGFLRRLYVEIRRFHLIGDTSYCRGKVTDKYIDGDKHIVKCEVYAEDQRKQKTAIGWAEAILPSKKA